MAWLKEKFSANNLAEWFILNDNPFYEHLWYLSAIAAVYVCIYVYTCWKKEEKDYGNLYQASFLLLIVHIFVGSFATAAGWELPYKMYRNAVFFGLPIFVLGIFLREYQEKIWQTYRLTKPKLIALSAIGICLTIVQRVGCGSVEMPIGSLILVISLILLLNHISFTKPRQNSGAKRIFELSGLSVYIYVMHCFWHDIYRLCLMDYMVSSIGEGPESYIRPVSVIAITVLTGIVWCILHKYIKKILTHAVKTK